MGLDSVYLYYLINNNKTLILGKRERYGHRLGEKKRLSFGTQLANGHASHPSSTLIYTYASLIHSPFTAVYFTLLLFSLFYSFLFSYIERKPLVNFYHFLYF